MSKTIAMTGATGFAGRHAVAELLKRGHRLVALARDPSRAGLPADVKLVAGDLASRSALHELVAGAEAVVHLAGAISGLRREDFFRVNVAGTEAVAQAAAGISRFIHISSLSAREPGLSHYGASKLAGEVAAERLSAKGDLLIIRPPAIYGAGDRATLPLLKALTGRTAIIPGRRETRFSLIHVQDLARIIADAVESGVTGQVEVSDGTAGGYGWDDLAGVAARAAGHPVRLVFLPRAIPAIAAHAVEAVARIVGKPGMISRGKIAELYHPDWVARGPGWPLDNPITFTRGFPETLAWYREAGWLPHPRGAGRSSARPNREAGP